MEDFNLADIMFNKKKRIFTREHRMKISMAKKGRAHSPEHCENISKALTGKTFSNTHKDRIRKALQGNRNALKNEVFLSDELMDLYGDDEGCRRWIEDNMESINESENVKTDYQLSQDNLKENVLYDDAIQINGENPPPSVVELLALNESPLRTSQDIKLSDII
jgi:hypothetical protein